jgi:hexokinase
VKSPNPGFQFFEKLTSGMYLGKMVMLNFKKIRPDLVIPDKIVNELFTGWQTNKIVKDTTRDLKETHQALQDVGLENFTLQDRKDLQHVTEVILNRSADLAAAALQAILQKMGETGENEITIGIDGSVYKLDLHYKARLKYTLDRLIALEENKVMIVDTEDGSGKGAALVVAASH